MVKSEKSEILTKLITSHEEIDRAHLEIKKLDTRLTNIEKINNIEHRTLQNQIKRTAWEVGNLIIGHRKEIADHSHRIEDTDKRLTDLQKIISWTIYTIAGLLITTLLGAIIKYFFAI